MHFNQAPTLGPYSLALIAFGLPTLVGQAPISPLPPVTGGTDMRPIWSRPTVFCVGSLMFERSQVPWYCIAALPVTRSLYAVGRSSDATPTGNKPALPRSWMAWAEAT